MNTQTRTIFARLPAAGTGERQRAQSNPATMLAKALDGHSPLGFAVMGSQIDISNARWLASSAVKFFQI
ncbi:MAG: hypothetical protein HS120_09560 [Burkholderiales bacterium]|nr:hypothetical protein [Burkholderiales bacterium]